MSQHLVTVWHLPADVRDAWIREGRLSPLAAVDVYAGPREYLEFFDTSENLEWPAQLNQLERPTVNAANYNHWFFPEVNRRRRIDAFHYVQARPVEYAAHVLEGARDMFTPSTQWHPLDDSGGSPHVQHRQLLGRYEAVYNRIVHGAPVPPVGLYVFLPLALAWGGRRAWSLVRSGERTAVARGSLLAFCLFQIGFVVAASSFFTFREAARYRFQIEPMIWLITALAVIALWEVVARRRRDPTRWWRRAPTVARQ